MQEINIAGKKLVKNKTLLLMHLDGTTKDEASNPGITESFVTYVDNQKFGKKGARFSGNASQAYIQVPTGNGSPLVLKTNFTIEFVCNFAGAAAIGEQIITSANSGQLIDFLHGYSNYNGGKPCFLVSLSVANDRSNYAVVDAPWLDAQPHHFALSVSNSVATVWLDGVLKATLPMTLAWGGSTMMIGNYITPAYGLLGTMQEYRISKVGRYTQPFTPPAAPFVID